jgi:hypothetical protein
MRVDFVFLDGGDDVVKDSQDVGQFPFLTTTPNQVGLGLLERDKTDRTVVPGTTCAKTTPMLSICVI